MLKRVILLACLAIVSFVGQAQKIILNFDVDTTVWDIADPLNLWLDFLGTRNDSLGATYWNQEEVTAYGPKDYFIQKHQLSFGMPDFLEFIAYGNIRILSIRERGAYHKISSSLSFLNEQDEEDLYAIFDVYAREVEGQWKLFNALYVNRELDLEQKKVGFLTYYFPKTHVFDMEKAIQQNAFLVDLAASFSIPLVEVDYYFAETNEEIQAIKGFSYLFGDNGARIPSGMAYVNQRMVFTNGSGEYYPHEIIHVLMNPHYPKAHYWINEGMATYFGMSRGQPLDWHLRKLDKHLKAHPEVDLSKMLSLQNIDGSTAYQYVLGGVIVKWIFENEGYPGLEKALQGGRSSADFYTLIENQLGIERDSINDVFRERIHALYESE